MSFVPEDHKSCWQIMHCGREPGGRNAEEQGICVAARMPGSACWLVAGRPHPDPTNMCFRLRSGRKSCLDCKVYSLVHDVALPSHSGGGGGGNGYGHHSGSWLDAIEW